METRWLPVPLVVGITALAPTLAARQRARFVRLCTGPLFARGRRTVTSWLRGCGAGRDFRRYYYLLGSVGRKAPALAAALLRILRKRLPVEGPAAPSVLIPCWDPGDITVDCPHTGGMTLSVPLALD